MKLELHNRQGYYLRQEVGVAGHVIEHFRSTLHLLGVEEGGFPGKKE